MGIPAFAYGIYALIKYKKKNNHDFAFDNLEKLSAVSACNIPNSATKKANPMQMPQQVTAPRQTQQGRRFAL